MHNFDNLDDISQSVLRSYTPTQNNAGKVGETVPLQDLERDGGKAQEGSHEGD
jgi:hypothetical protein